MIGSDDKSQYNIYVAFDVEDAVALLDRYILYTVMGSITIRGDDFYLFSFPRPGGQCSALSFVTKQGMSRRFGE